MRSTALCKVHESLGARMVPFAGWTMPVQYGASILEEVAVVRQRAGLFDLGHMGRVAITGRDAEAFLQRLQTNDVLQIPAGGIRYAMILDDRGLTQDDILVYREPDTRQGFFLVVNASNTEADLRIMRATASPFRELQIVDQTDDLGMFAIQGPAALSITQSLTAIDLAALKYYGWTRGVVGGVSCGISRTGYTGEDGFELYPPRAQTAALWQAVAAAGKEYGIAPCGLGARDILRLEAGMALYGHEIDPTTSPFEAGLMWGVKLTHDFTGRAALEAVVKSGGTGRRLIGLTTKSKRVPRQGHELWDGGRKVGVVCSGGASPTLGTNIATAYVASDVAQPGRAVEFAIKDKREPATLTALPFYKRAR